MNSGAVIARIALKRPTVPETCLLDPLVVIAAIMHGEYPCDRCNHDRAQCHGTPRRPEIL